MLDQKKRYIDLGLSTLSEVISDNCDTTPFVKISVYSDEYDVAKHVAAKLSRRFSNNGLFVGWQVYVIPYSAKNCDGKSNICSVPDGRVYTVRICAKDDADLETCQEVTSGVRQRKAEATSHGKLFLLVEDAAYLNKAPSF